MNQFAKDLSVTDYELITDIKLLTDVDNKDERNHKENHLRYVSHNVTHSRRFTTYEQTLAFLVNSSWSSQISIIGCVINKI